MGSPEKRRLKLGERIVVCVGSFEESDSVIDVTGTDGYEYSIPGGIDLEEGILLVLERVNKCPCNFPACLAPGWKLAEDESDG